MKNNETQSHYDFFFDQLPESLSDYDRHIIANHCTVYLLEQKLIFINEAHNKNMEIINRVFNKKEEHEKQD